MPELTSPFDGAVIDVPEASVDRFVEQGWLTSKAPAKKAAAKKAPVKSGDEK